MDVLAVYIPHTGLSGRSVVKHYATHLKSLDLNELYKWVSCSGTKYPDIQDLREKEKEITEARMAKVFHLLD